MFNGNAGRTYRERRGRSFYQFARRLCVVFGSVRVVLFCAAAVICLCVVLFSSFKAPVAAPGPRPRESGSARQGEELLLGCPENHAVITEVTFASYGRPHNVPRQKINSNCHAPESSDVVRALCLGAHACRVDVSHAFRDWNSCGGEEKWLSATVKCGVTAPDQLDALLVCHADWVGIRESTWRIGRALRIPVLMVKTARDFDELYERGSASHVIVQGVPEGTLAFAERSLPRGDIVTVIYHSGVGVHNSSPEESILLGELLAASKQGAIKFAFLEDDQTAYAQALGVPACSLPTSFSPGLMRASPRGRLKIGLIGTSFRPGVKNFFTQISAACMVDGAEIHINDFPSSQLGHIQFCRGTLISHGTLSPDQVTPLISEMSVNLYVSWTDAMPMMVINSLEQGVPVIVSDSSPFFDSSPTLRDLLVEPRIDDPAAIHGRTLRVLAFVQEHRQEFEDLVRELLRKLHAHAQGVWSNYVRTRSCADIPRSNYIPKHPECKFPAPPACEKDPSSSTRVTMVWTTGVETFGIRNQWSIESVFKHHPCSPVVVLSDTLPLDFFVEYHSRGYRVTVRRLAAELAFLDDGDSDTPGAKWMRRLSEWRKGQFFAVHFSDMIRMIVMHRHGGTYLDFDHIVTRTMSDTLFKNSIGSEVCHSDNPDCFSVKELVRMGVVRTSEVDSAARGASRDMFSGIERYTPCNGVMINWSPGHPIFLAALREADLKYDTECWGCLGPRMLATVIKAHPTGTWKFQLEAPGTIYPFSYETAAQHLQKTMPATETLMRSRVTYGAHFYGKTTALTVMTEDSTMARITRKNSLSSDGEFVVHDPSVPFCKFPRQVSNVSSPGE